MARKDPRTVCEVWVYTDYLRECYAASGLNAASIQVVPLGIDPKEFNPEAAPDSDVRKLIGDRYAFFFNGGFTLRKGIDVLVNAYLNEFAASEAVCLIVKGSDFYRRGELAEKIEALSRRTDIARIYCLTGAAPPALLPGLYAACDCYVHPYRAEGYGLPIAEAMACGKPVIVTGAGAARDFADEDTAYLVKCAMETMRGRSVSGMPTVASPFWLRPDADDLRRLMRYVFEHRDEAAQQGQRASARIRERHTWRHSALAAGERLAALAAA